MKRVAALFLPHWPIERLRRAEPTAAPPEAAEHTLPRRNTGWRPGARWAADPSSPGGGPRSGGGVISTGDVASGEYPSVNLRAPPPPPGEELKPLVTRIQDGNRLVVAAACPHALALGVRPGMPLTQARIQTPGLDIRPADPEGDRAALEGLAMLAARRWSPIVAIEGVDTLFIDLTGTAHLFGGEARMARRLARLLARHGYTARIAVADTPGAAWALARTHGGTTICPPGEHGEALAPLPIDTLRVDPAAVELLRRLGIDRIGQLAQIPRAPLVRRFGSGIATRLLRALGDLPEPLTPIVPPQPIAITQRFAEPIATPEAIAHWLETLVARIVEALAETGQGARAIELVAARVDGVPQRIRIGLARPSRDGAHLLKLMLRRIEQIEPGYGIDSLTLHIRRAERLGPEPFTERLDEEAAPDLAPLVDTLATRIGLDAMWRAAPVESDIPERATARAPVLDPPDRSRVRGKADDIRQLDRNPPLPPWHAGWPRPARLLARPERLDHVIAELPDQPPRRFTWRGTVHRVVRADGPERVQGEWWKRAAEMDSIRDYFHVEDEGGRRYWLFRSGDGERAVSGDLSWYLHGVFG